MIKVLELFAGVGACSKALENLNIPHEIVDAVEIDKYAIASFNAIHGTNFAPQDITKWDKDIECDLIMHGSPCQDFSIAGKQAGGDANSGTRSSLMYETLRIVEKLKPKYVIWENVKNLLGSKHRHNFDAYIASMTKLGYNNYHQVLNAKDYGVPQNRERVFTVSIRNDGEFDSYFLFPERKKLDKRIKDVLETQVDEKYYLSDKTIAGYTAHTKRHKARGNGFRFEPIDGDAIAHTISTRAGQRPTDNYIKIIDDTFGFDKAPRIYDKVSPALRAARQGLKTADSFGCTRKLTPKECWRLMGFSDEDFSKAAKINSDTQLYKQAGNSIVVAVLEAILKELLC